jgi:outer membrane murein-binding lipoprotein Lpp
MPPEKDNQKNPDLVTDTKKELETQPKDKESEAKSKEESETIDETNSWLNSLEEWMIHNYFAWKMWKKFDDCSKQEQEWVKDMSELIFKRIKKLQRVPLDITINSWIGGLMWMISIFKPNASLPTEQQQKIDQISWTVWKIEAIRDQFEWKMSAVMSQMWMWNSTIDLWDLNNAFTQIETEITKLKTDKNALKEAAKLKNMTVKTYYASQTKFLVNNYIFALLGWKKIPETVSNTSQNSMPIIPPVATIENNNIHEEDEWDEFKDVKVRADDNLDDLKYTSENDMIPVKNIKSHPFDRNPETWTTLCSQTARLNVEQFLWMKKDALLGTDFGGNALDVQERCGSKIVVWSKIGDGKVVDIQSSFTQDIKWNYFDIFTASKSKFWHRLVWFRSEPSNQIYVMDPYNIKKDDHSSREPIKIEEYIKTVCEAKSRPILKIVWYETKKKVVDSEEVIAQVKNGGGKVISMNNDKKIAA